jgi:hypothetical protein
LVKGYPLHLKNLESSPRKDHMCQVWLTFGQWFWRRSRKCKSLQTDRQTDIQKDKWTPDNGRSEKLTWAFSSGELTIGSFQSWWWSSVLSCMILELTVRSFACPEGFSTK